ncbi:acyl-CoA thioesterase [Sneathiella aquimaris]|uniref:acyl-CoA thioesterase n=1 Tax=Sneathiella aquimaris TaxID=2599305 RepID=UPI00146CA9C3|nr:thioesterase family protein [Sneathiella aquimaris]
MSGYIESYRGHVLASECDVMGHMNVQFYNACVSQAMGTMFGALGVTPQIMNETQRGFAAVEQTNRYHAELLAGDIVHINSGVLKTSSRTITFQHKLFNSSTETLSYEATVTAVYMNLEARKSELLPDALTRKAETLLLKEGVGA